MKKARLQVLIGFWTLSALSIISAHGQTINNQENAANYGNARGWTVYSMSDGRGFFSCRAVRGNSYVDQIMIEYDGFDEMWKVIVQARRGANDDGVGSRGAGAYYDGELIDRQVGFGVPGHDGSSQTHAQMNLESYEFGRFKSGSTFRLDINGEQSRRWSLSGSTATILKVQECYNNQGVAPLRKTPQKVQTPQRNNTSNQRLPFFTNSMDSCTGYGNWAVKIIRQAQTRGCDVRRTGEVLDPDFHMRWCNSQTTQMMAAAPNIHSNGVRQRCRAMGYPY